MRSRLFRMFVPSGYACNPVASGRIGAKPDPELVDHPRGGDPARSRLPGFIGDLVFTFPTGVDRRERVQNFYAMREFLIVSQTVKDFLLQHLPEADVEIRQISVLHGDGKPAVEPYFALKILRTIECVDPATSTVAELSGATKSFSEMTVRYELDPHLTREYANKNGTHYVSYPSWNIRDVCLKEDEVPADAVLFRPAYWPGKLIIDLEFGYALQRQCSGGTPADYFWMLNLKGVDQSLHEHLVAYR